MLTRETQLDFGGDVADCIDPLICEGFLNIALTSNIAGVGP